MADWQTGDLALCVREPFGEVIVAWNPVPGAIYTVADYDSVWSTLDFEEDPEKFDPEAGWEPSCFVKVTPPAADEFDRETIDMMNRVGAPA